MDDDLYQRTLAVGVRKLGPWTLLDSPEDDGTYARSPDRRARHTTAGTVEIRTLTGEIIDTHPDFAAWLLHTLAELHGTARM